MKDTIRINELNIKSFRGIVDLNLKDCGDVNIILGDNNCGKTSVLEAVQLFKNNTISNVIDLARTRKIIGGNLNLIDFIYLFNTKNKKIDVSAEINNKNNNVYLDFNTTEIQFNKDVFLGGESNPLSKSTIASLIDNLKIDGKPTNQINGTFVFNDKKEKYSYIPLDFTFGRYKLYNSNTTSNNIVYESPYTHFQVSNSMISSVKKDPDFYKYFIAALKEFDSEIENVDLLSSNDSEIETTEINIKSKGQYVPLFAYGDGIKKVMCISSMIYKAKNGILLIDEIETSLHHSYYKDILYFMIKLCKAYNVQLFITTHNNEIIKELTNFNKENKIKVKMQFYTIKKKQDKTVERVLNDEEASNFKSLGGDVRD